MAEAPPIESGRSAESRLAGPGSAALGRTDGGPAVGPVRAWLRFFLSELRQVFLRRRNLLLLAVCAWYTWGDKKSKARERVSKLQQSR